MSKCRKCGVELVELKNDQLHTGYAHARFWYRYQNQKWKGTQIQESVHLTFCRNEECDMYKIVVIA